MHAKNISWIVDWRKEQEDNLIVSAGQGMNSKEVRRFAQFFIPFCHFASETLALNSNKTHCILEIGRDHTPKEIRLPFNN